MHKGHMRDIISRKMVFRLFAPKTIPHLMKSTYKMDYISLIKVKNCEKFLEKSTKMWHAHCTPFTRAAEKNPSKKAYLPKLAERESRPKHLPPFRKR